MSCCCPLFANAGGNRRRPQQPPRSAPAFFPGVRLTAAATLQALAFDFSKCGLPYTPR